MKLNELPKITARQQKRKGRGIGSGKGGHTTGRGQKGQKSRGKIALTFEGTKIKKSLLKRLPFLRGKGRFKPKARPFVVNLKYLNLLPDGAVVDVNLLIEKRIVGMEAKVLGVKILGDGEITKNLTVKLPVSKGAKIKIEKAGGKIVNANTPVAEKETSSVQPEKKTGKIVSKKKS